MGLSGKMKPETGYFSAEGIPVVPVYDSGAKDPYQMANITVRDATGTILASTKTTIPTSDEINCAKCHGRNGQDAFDNILTSHDRAHKTKLMTSKPVLCASCHGSPALGLMTPGSSGKYLSYAIHGFHATKYATCYDCHPGVSGVDTGTALFRSSHGHGNLFFTGTGVGEGIYCIKFLLF